MKYYVGLGVSLATTAICALSESGAIIREGVADLRRLVSSIRTKSTSCSLSDISGWRAGVLYPLAGDGRKSCAAQLRRRDACSTCSGRRSGCWPQMVRSPAAPIPFLVIFRFGATLELGRSERTTMRPLWRYGVDAANIPDRKPR